MRRHTVAHIKKTHTHTHEIARADTHTHRRNLRTQTLPLGHMQSEQRETLLPLSWWQWDQWLIDKRAAEKGNILPMSWRNPPAPLLPFISHFKWQMAKDLWPWGHEGVCHQTPSNSWLFLKYMSCFFFFTGFHVHPVRVRSFQCCFSCLTLEWLLSAWCKYGWLCQTALYQQVTDCAIYVRHVRSSTAMELQNWIPWLEKWHKKKWVTLPWTTGAKAKLNEEIKPKSCFKSRQCNIQVRCKVLESKSKFLCFWMI